MSYLLITYNFDWADEFSVEGFGVYTVEQWNEVKQSIKQYIENGNYEFSFGTNEYLEFSTFEDWEIGINTEPISDLEAESLIKLFRLSDNDWRGPTFGTATNVISKQELED